MARDMLSIPATSAGSERAFSTGKDCFGIARMSLNTETVEALICLRSWFKAVKPPALRVFHKCENLICVQVGLLRLQRLMEKPSSKN
ncbi:hypothetical protein OUZ56_005655 [Daphnia magna]|uniref:HAT C-terminal dimerisation domain-containing protein n=1 Tax=Daphnia magna TaxID=35525 RepID=A0ABQ9YTD7_9CRUS|nr:hypothetical protein OUZ56_005655 [Daphnia magna]